MTSCLKNNILLIATFTSVVLGVAIGIPCRLLNPSDDTILLVGFPGEIFMRMLKMLILPLLVGSMITGLSGFEGKSTGNISLATIALYVTTSLIASIIGLTLALTIRPGLVDRGLVISQTVIDGPTVSARDVFLDLVRNLFPENIFQGTIEKIGTTYENDVFGQTVEESDLPSNSSLSSLGIVNVTTVTTDLQPNMSTQWKRKLVYRSGTNTLGLIVYCVIFGIILGKTGEKGKVMLSFFTTLNCITMKMVQLVMWYSPIGIFFLIASKVMTVGDLAGIGRRLGVFILTNIVGYSLHALIILPLIYLALTRSNPFRVARAVLQALVMVIGTDSSAATLPVTLRCCEEHLKLDKTITRFVLPIGATVNMDGAAVFQAISPIFVAQLRGIGIHFTDGIVVCLCAVLGSVGTAAVPGSGIVALLMVLSALSLPIEDVYMVVAVDWFLSRLRGAVNVFGDCLIAGILSHYFSRDRVREETDFHAVNVEIV